MKLITGTRDASIKEALNPLLGVDIEEDFSKITYTCASGQLVVEEPRLMWDCSCFSYDAEGIYRQLRGRKKTCAIHRHGAVAADITRLFRSGFVELRYCGLSFLWKDEDNFFPPSFDSVSLLKDAEKAGAFDLPIASAIDVGSGTGFLGLVALQRCPAMRKLCFVEWVTTPLIFSCINFSLNQHKLLTPVELSGHLGYDPGMIGFDAAPYDLLLSNPPYLPMVDGFPGVMANATSGTDLLSSIIRNKRFLAKRAYICFSHIALPEAALAVKSAGCELVPINDARRVPFRNVYALQERRYVDELVRSRGLEYCPEDPAYLFWHRVQSFEIRG